MGTYILVIAFVIEVIFAAYCIVTKSDQNKVRSLIRIGSLAAFAVFVLVSVIEWNFRWYGLAALLLVWAALGAWRLIGGREVKKEYKTLRIILNALAVLLLVFIAVTPALIFPPYHMPPVTGKYQVATISDTYIDASRIETFTNTGENRKVNVEFWYPADAGLAQADVGTYPLIVFSPGSFGTRSSNTTTFMELASNGYVVCSIDHPYHSFYTVDTEGNSARVDPSFLQEVMDANTGKYDDETDFRLTQKWTALRTADINFVLNTILAHTKDTGSSPVYSLINTDKIGLIGHSLGGAASGQVARERADIDAVVNLDADLLGEYLDFVDGEAVINDKIYPVPLLTIYSDDMMRVIAKVADQGLVIAGKQVTANAPDAHEVYIAGTNHFSLTDLPLLSPFLVSVITSSANIGGVQEADKYEILEKMNQIVLDFFNAYLKGEGNFTSANVDR
jgi:dienelactone hydrolase